MFATLKQYKDSSESINFLFFGCLSLCVIGCFAVQILREKKCFTFEARRWFPVANMSITHYMGAFEYGETGKLLPHNYAMTLYVYKCCGYTSANLVAIIHSLVMVIKKSVYDSQ